MSGYVFEHYGQRVVVDTGGQVIRAELEDQYYGHEPATALHPSVASVGLGSDFTPMMALAAKSKAFDDRLMARLEGLLHHGVAEHEGLYALVEWIRAQLPPKTKARGLLDAASCLGQGTQPEWSRDTLPMRRWLKDFRRDASRSQPLGIYTQSEDLERLFKHDRILQSRLDPDVAEPIAQVLRAAPERMAAYRAHLALIARITGPLALPSVLEEPVMGLGVALLPASDSAEGRLVKELLGGRPAPEGFELGAEVAQRIRDGRLPTQPTPDDGWYAHQFHANAALLFPETEGLRIGPRYAEQLEDVFKALFALDRETHVKQLECPVGAGIPPLVVAPRLTVEPVPEHYARRADAYRFLREQLVGLLGEVVVYGASVDGYGASLGDALVEMEAVFRGAALIVWEELGHPRERSAERDAARALFRAWQRRSVEDPDLALDMRIAVPLHHDPERGTVTISAMIGLTSTPLGLEFVERPGVHVHGGDELDAREPDFQSLTVSILSASTLECEVKVPPTRERLRAICDQARTPRAIKAALQKDLR